MKKIMSWFLIAALILPNAAFATKINGQLEGAILEKKASDPAATEARIYYNTASKKAKIHNGTDWTEIGSGGGGLFDSGQNLITNNSWEVGTTGWTASGGDYQRVTAAANIVPPGVGAASWDPSASGQTLSGNTITITAGDGLDGRNGVLSCAVKTAATDLKMQVFDGTNVITPNESVNVVPSSSAGFVRYSLNFTFPHPDTTATVSPRFYSQSNSAIAYIDDCYLGLADGFNSFNSTVTSVPTVQIFTSGSGTYTLPTSPKPLYIDVEMVGGGGGGGGGGSSGNGNGGSGGTTSFNSVNAAGGGGGIAGPTATGSGGSSGGAGGTGGSGTATVRTGGDGGVNGSGGYAAVFNGSPGSGGSSLLGGGGIGADSSGAGNGQAGRGYGGGGGGGGAGSGGRGAPGGGGGGEYVKLVISSPAATYSYSVGAGGTAGTAGTGGGSGGTGGSGVIIVREFYQQSETAYRPDQTFDRTGEIMAFAGSCPNGTIPANNVTIGLSGATYSGGAYYNLYSKMWSASLATSGKGVTISSAAGASAAADWAAGKTLTLDFRDLFLRGIGTYNTTLGAYQADQMQGHKHSVTDPGHTHSGNWSTGTFSTASNPAGSWVVGNATSGSTNSAYTSLTVQNPTTDGSNGTPRTGSETRPMNVGVNYCVNYTGASAALLLVGSVTSNSTGLVRTEYAQIVDNGSACVINSQSGTWLTSPTRNGAGDCSFTISSGIYGGKPYCTIGAEDPTNTVNMVYGGRIKSSSSTALRTLAQFAGNDSQNVTLNIICNGPK